MEFQLTPLAQAQDGAPATADEPVAEKSAAAAAPPADPAQPPDAAEPEGHDGAGHQHHLPSRKAKSDEQPPAAKPGDATFVCPMHPEVVSKQPGRCPKCGMKLEPVQKKVPKGSHK